ncbi:MAG: epoxyqueuosine reductase QueH [Clostridia bacterium]|nr:epoxyqueuosine reductase QueH [Clostridia bacterium]
MEKDNKRLLVHACCAPCLVAVYDNISTNLDEFGINSIEDFDVIWYNINIHPKVEYLRRMDTLKQYLNIVGKQGIYLDEYNMYDFVTNAISFKEKGYSMRCEYCYYSRLDKVFKYAKDNGYYGVTTTLLISPYQKHDKIIEVCKRLEDKYGVKFVYKDFRPYFREGQNKARELGLYRQRFCGCIFSIDEGGKITIN